MKWFVLGPYFAGISRVESNGYRNFLKKVQSSFMVFYFYILFQIHEIANSESEIIYTYNLQPGYRYSFIVKFVLSLGSTSFFKFFFGR